MKAALALLSLFWALPCAAQGASAKSRDFRLIYHEGFTFSVSTNLLDALERVLSSDSAHVSLEKIEIKRGYYANGNFLYDLPADVRREDIPFGAAVRAETSELDVLETPKEAVFVSTETAFPLVDKILGYSQDRLDEQTYDPGVRKKKGSLARIGLPDGREISALRISGIKRGTQWRGTMALHYHLLVDGKPVTVVSIGKPLGGPDRLKSLLNLHLAQIKEPVLRFSIGNIGLPPEYGVPDAQAAMLKDLGDSGYRFLAFSEGDIDLAWNDMLSAAGKGLKLLCTNLRPIGKSESPIERFHVEEVLGVKVGFISLVAAETGELLARKKLPFEVEDTMAAAKEAIKELRGAQKADLIVAVSHLDSKDDLKLLQEIEGIDIYLESLHHAVASSRKTTIELTDWSRERHTHPVLRAIGPHYSYSEIALGFKPAESGFELSRVEELPGPTSPDEPEYAYEGAYPEKVLSFFLKSKEALLPDPRKVWPDARPPKLMYFPEEFWNLAAQLLRRHSGAELALLRINNMSSNVTGEMTESYVSQWMFPPERAVTARLPGRALKALLKHVSFIEGPVKPDDARPRFSSEVRLAGAGIDKAGRISGLPISDDESYTIATTEELLQKTAELPELKQAADVTPLGPGLPEVVLKSLKERRDTDEELRRLMEGKTPPSPVWRLNLRELAVDFSNTQVAGNDAFTQVSDARVQGVGQIVTEGSAKLFSELYWGRMRWDAGVSADYGRLTLKPKGIPAVVNVIKDDLLFETEIRRRSFSIEKRFLHASLGPFLAAAYDTQFTKPSGLPKREIVRYKTGLKAFDGWRLKELSLGPAVQTDYSFATPHTQTGYAAGLKWESPLLRTAVNLKAEASYLEFFPNHTDTAADLRRTFDLSVKLRVPFYNALHLSPFVNYYLFEGKTVKTTGYNVQFGFALDYARLWKPFF